MRIPVTPLLLLLWCLMPDICRGALVDIQRYKQLIVMIHNTYRSYEKAADMKALKWDPYLQRRAAEWSETCHWGHQGQGLGENLATFWTNGPQMPIADIIVKSCQNWWKEVHQWSWSTSCGSACHYTQMIWGKTERIGCSLSKCQSMGEGMNNADYFVCFYDPPGNYMGQYPYTRGSSCSRCNPGDICTNRLCSTPSRRRIKPSRRRIMPGRVRIVRFRQPASRRTTYRYVPAQPRRVVTYRRSDGETVEPGEGPSEAAPGYSEAGPGYSEAASRYSEGATEYSGGENPNSEGTHAAELR